MLQKQTIQKNIPQTTPNDWDVFATGFNPKEVTMEMIVQTQDYRTGDVVRVGGYTYPAIANPKWCKTSNLTYWEKLNEGANWRNTWTDATAYDKGDVVQQGVNSCILEHTLQITV